MSPPEKLRALRERLITPDGPCPTDLRGFNDPELLLAGAPSVRLFGRTTSGGSTAIRSVASAYDLEHSSEPGRKGTFQLRRVRERPGEHKHQALSLFLASLELHRAEPSFRGCLYLHHGMHQLIRSRLKNRLRPLQEVRRIEIPSEASTVLLLEDCVAHYLGESTLFKLESGLRALTRMDLAHAHDELVKEERKSSQDLQTKVGC